VAVDAGAGLVNRCAEESRAEFYGSGSLSGWSRRLTAGFFVACENFPLSWA
jgi:hypothetical protein